MALLNEIATYLNEQTGVVLKVGEGESATDYSIGFNITTEESETPNKSANKANRSDNDPLGKINNSFTQNSDDALVRGDSVRGSASRTKSAIKNDEGVFAGAHEILHLLGSGHKNGIMSDGATSGGVTEDIYGAILKGVGIGNGSIGSGNKNAIGQGHIRSESGDRPKGFVEGSIMNKAKFDRQMQRAVEKRIKQDNKK